MTEQSLAPTELDDTETVDRLIDVAFSTLRERRPERADLVNANDAHHVVTAVLEALAPRRVERERAAEARGARAEAEAALKAWPTMTRDMVSRGQVRDWLKARVDAAGRELASVTRQEWRIVDSVGYQQGEPKTSPDWNENYSLWDAVSRWYKGGRVETRTVTEYEPPAPVATRWVEAPAPSEDDIA